MEQFYPLEWMQVTGSEFVVDPKSDIVDGPFGSNLKSSEYIDSGVPIARIQNVKRFRFIDKNIRFVSTEKAEQLRRHSFISGDILITKLGDPLGLACEVPKLFKFGIIVADLVRFRPNINVCSKPYILYLLNSEIVTKQIEAHVKGTTRPRINLGVIRNLSLPLAPLAEQKVISDKLDSMLAQVETTKARLERIPEILKTFRQSVLASAVSGKLTEEWRKYNPSAKVTIEHNSKLPKLSEEDFYTESVDDWSWIRFGSVVTLINGDRGKNYPNKSEYVEQGVPFINTGHIDSDGTLSDVRMNYISHEKYDSLGGGKTQPIDLVYCLRGATMGKTARVHYSVGAIASSLVIVRPSINIHRDFAYYFLISPAARKLINEFDNGSAQPNLSAKSLATYPLQLPPIDEQTEIVRRVEELLAFADSVEAKANAALERVNKLTQSILAKAFRGELTADWRAEHPDLISGENSAEALLERIKAERAALSKKTTKKKSAKK